MPTLTATVVTLARVLSNTGVNRHVWIGSLTSIAAPAGVAKGHYLWFDREAMEVLDASVNPVVVRRGAAGTACAGHVGGTAGYSGPAYLFSSVDPVGIPPAFPLANPWINVRDGRVWIAMGDESGPGVAARFWQLQVVGPPTPGALGALQPGPTTP